MISIVCVYNDDKTVRELLLKSLEKQTVPYELIKIDNTDNHFASAAEALNYGGDRAKGDYIMFVHQDVSLLSDTWLAEAENILNGLPGLGIAGVAGAADERGVIGNLEQGVLPKRAWSTPIKSPERVQTLDECLVIVPKKMFDGMQFDAKTCNGWHLYAVDYCLSCLEAGHNAYALPLETYHRSDGMSIGNGPRASIILKLGLSYTAYPRDYYRVLKAVLHKHKEAGSIYTTCGIWKTGYPLSLQKSVLLELLKYPWRRIRRRARK